LIEILQAVSVVESESRESELEQIEKCLLDEPFEPFIVAMEAGKRLGIEQRDQCGFTRSGSVQLIDVGGSFLSSDRIARVQKV